MAPSTRVTGHWACVVVQHLCCGANGPCGTSGAMSASTAGHLPSMMSEFTTANFVARQTNSGVRRLGSQLPIAPTPNRVREKRLRPEIGEARSRATKSWPSDPATKTSSQTTREVDEDREPQTPDELTQPAKPGSMSQSRTQSFMAITCLQIIPRKPHRSITCLRIIPRKPHRSLIRQNPSTKARRSADRAPCTIQQLLEIYVCRALVHQGARNFVNML